MLCDLGVFYAGDLGAIFLQPTASSGSDMDACSSTVEYTSQTTGLGVTQQLRMGLEADPLR